MKVTVRGARFGLWMVGLMLPPKLGLGVPGMPGAPGRPGML